MRKLVAFGILVGTLATSQFAVAQDQPNTCARLEQDGTCLCAIPKEWVPSQVGDLSEIVGNVLVSGSAGYTPPTDGKIPLFSGDNIVVPAQASALLAFGQYCQKTLPANSSALITQIEECACAQLTKVPPAVPWWPAAAAVAGGGIVVVVTTLPGSPGDEESP